MYSAFPETPEGREAALKEVNYMEQNLRLEGCDVSKLSDYMAGPRE